MLGMADLSKEDWGGQLSQTVTKAQDEARYGVQCVTVRKRSHYSSNYHQHTTDGNGKSAAPSVCEKWPIFVSIRTRMVFRYQVLTQVGKSKYFQSCRWNSSTQV